MDVQTERDGCLKNHIHSTFGLVRITRKKRRNHSRKALAPAFTLIEILIVFSILLSLLALLGLAVTSGRNEAEIVKREATELALWLSERMNQARLEEGDFRIYVSEWSPQNCQLTLSWLTGANATKSVSYKTDKVYVRNESLVYQFVYDHKWQTLTPAVTYSVRSLTDPSKYKMSVTVSGTGYVNVK